MNHNQGLQKAFYKIEQTFSDSDLGVHETLGGPDSGPDSGKVYKIGRPEKLMWTIK